MKKPTFLHWLLQQTKRDDPVGVLARRMGEDERRHRTLYHAIPKTQRRLRCRPDDIEGSWLEFQGFDLAVAEYNELGQ